MDLVACDVCFRVSVPCELDRCGSSLGGYVLWECFFGFGNDEDRAALFPLTIGLPAFFISAVVFVQDARFYFDQEMVQGDVFDVAGGVAAVCTFRSPHKSTANEDSAGVMPLPGDAAVLAVADGMGGGAAGERASRTTLEALHAALRGAAASELPLRSAILNGIESANQAVCDIGLGSGSTLAVAEIQNDTVRTYHVGDSMILTVGQRGRVKMQTVPHSPTGYAVEAGLLDDFGLRFRTASRQRQHGDACNKREFEATEHWHGSPSLEKPSFGYKCLRMLPRCSGLPHLLLIDQPHKSNV